MFIYGVIRTTILRTILGVLFDLAVILLTSTLFSKMSHNGLDNL